MLLVRGVVRLSEDWNRQGKAVSTTGGCRCLMRETVFPPPSSLTVPPGVAPNNSLAVSYGRVNSNINKINRFQMLAGLY